MIKTTRQKFFRGDVVRVAKKLPKIMGHQSGFDAIIMGSFFDRCSVGILSFERNGRPAEDQSCFHEYSIMDIKNGNEISWYPESVLKSINLKYSESQIHEIKIQYHRRLWEIEILAREQRKS